MLFWKKLLWDWKFLWGVLLVSRCPLVDKVHRLQEPNRFSTVLEVP